MMLQCPLKRGCPIQLASQAIAARIKTGGDSDLVPFLLFEHRADGKKTFENLCAVTMNIANRSTDLFIRIIAQIFLQKIDQSGVPLQTGEQRNGPILDRFLLAYLYRLGCDRAWLRRGWLGDLIAFRWQSRCTQCLVHTCCRGSVKQ